MVNAEEYGILWPGLSRSHWGDLRSRFSLCGRWIAANYDEGAAAVDCRVCAKAKKDWEAKGDQPWRKAS